MTKIFIFIKNYAVLGRNFVLDLIFPIECISCGEDGVWCCDSCFNKIKFKENQYCLVCKKENKTGSICVEHKFNLDGCLIAGDYEDDILAELVKKFKYNFIKDLNDYLVRFLTLFLNNFLKNKDNIFFKSFSDILIIPVPLHQKRKNWRGFNQAELLAFGLAGNFNIDVDFNNLVRLKNNKAQAKLREVERQNNLSGCFSWLGENLSGKNILLIDDVTTTGATLNEIALILKKNGAMTVWGLVVAKG